MSALQRQFDDLADALRQLIALLDEADERFWVPYLKRGLRQVEENRLSGATFVLGCYGGEDTFSDLVIGGDWQSTDRLKFQNLNRRLEHLRTRVFDAADAITSRRAW